MHIHNMARYYSAIRWTYRCRRIYIHCKAINKYVEDNEPRHLIYAYANNKGAYQRVHPRSLISEFVIPYLDYMMPLVSISKCSWLLLVSVAAQIGLCLIWSVTPKTGFSWRKRKKTTKTKKKKKLQNMHILNTNVNEQSMWVWRTSLRRMKKAESAKMCT